MVLEQQDQYESQWACIMSIAPKIDCARESLRRWVCQVEHDLGLRDGATTDERSRIKELERDLRELRQANEILRKSSEVSP